jgi:hypothetical protein
MNLTKREHFTLELAKAVIANTHAISLSSEHLARNSVADADAIIAELDRTATIRESLTVPADDGWIDHVPTDPIPDSCEKVRFSDGYEAEWDDYDDRCWNHTDSDIGNHIIKWRPAQ